MDWALRLCEDPRISIEDMYSKDSSKFTIALHHSGKFDYGQDNLLVYSGGSVDFADYVDPDFMSIHEIIIIAKELGAEEVTGCWYRNPGQPLHQGLTELATDRDIVLMTKWVPRYRVIDIYVTHCQFPEEAEPLSTEYPEDETEKCIISDDEEEGEEKGEEDGEEECEEEVEEDGEEECEEDGEEDGEEAAEADAVHDGQEAAEADAVHDGQEAKSSTLSLNLRRINQS